MHAPFPRVFPTRSLGRSQTTQTFDALVSAIGNYHEPNLPDLPGMRSFPGIQVPGDAFTVYLLLYFAHLAIIDLMLLPSFN